jgi:hypothetical protein
MDARKDNDQNHEYQVKLCFSTKLQRLSRMAAHKMIKFQVFLIVLTLINMMMILNTLRKSFLTALICATFGVAMVGCSDDKSDFDPMDQTKIEPVPDKEKIEFEHAFAEQCVTRELKNSKNPEADKAGLESTCLCVSKYLMKNLTEQEAEKFLDDGENPESLVIKYDAAAYHCLQENAVKGPDFSKK